MPRPKMNLSGAYGIVPPPTPAMIAHPERVRRILHLEQLLWVLRIAVVGGGLYLLYELHRFQL